MGNHGAVFPTRIFFDDFHGFDDFTIAGGNRNDDMFPAIDTTLIQDALSTLDPAILRDTQAIVLFGSCARQTQRPQSDIDVLLISKRIRFRDVIASHPYDIDLLVTPAAKLQADLVKKHKFNNNLVMDIFRQCTILQDTDQIAGRLMQQASALFEQGPVAMSPGEAERAQHELKAGKVALGQMLRKFDSASLQDRALAQMRQDQIVKQAFYLYFKARRQWSSAFHKLIEQCQREGSPQMAAWQRYVAADVFSGERQAALNAIIDCTLDALADIARSEAIGPPPYQPEGTVASP